MLNVYPDYYPQFHCIAERCRHNCCIGWEIDIDAGTLSAYRAMDGALGERLRTLNEDTPLESITLIGLCTDICVISNALLLRAYLPEVPILVDAACCAGVTPQSHRTALAAMRACQIIVENAPEE